MRLHRTKRFFGTHRKALVWMVALSLWAWQAGIEAASANAIAGGSAGRQLQDIQEQMERARVEREMEEQRAKEKADIRDAQTKPQNQEGAVRFILKGIAFDASEVLSESVRHSVAQPYIGHEVTLDELYQIVAAINACYAEKKYLTCRAYLPPQTIHQGVVRIALIEGKNGSVMVEGNRHTNSSYILGRIPIETGRVESMDGLTERLRRFNGTNDVQLRVSLKAGDVPGTTDYVIAAQEPVNSSFTLYADHAGSFTTGEWREGLFYSNRSLFGSRDALSLGGLRSTGMRSFNAGYSLPIGRSGTRLVASYSTNGTEVVAGQYRDWGIPVEGHASSYGMTFTQPLVVKDHAKIEASLGWQRMHSVTDIAGIQLINDTFSDYTAGVSATFYGRGCAFYQRHSFTHGSWEDNSPAGRIAKPSSDYNLYHLNVIFQQAAQHGQLFTFRTNMQYSFSDDLRPSKQFYLGGAYSVRGYKENAVGGNNGLTASLEYSVPVMKKKALSVYGFFDYGTLWGANLPGHHSLSSFGIGLRARVQALYLDFCVGFPMQRELDGYERVSGTHYHLTASMQF